MVALTPSTLPVSPPARIARLTAGDVLLAALHDIAVYAARETALKSADQILGLRHLNTLLDEWTADGWNQWRQDDADVTWPANTVELSADALMNAPITETDAVGLDDILEVSFVGTNFRRILARWDVVDYQRLPNPETQGEPSAYVVRQGLVGPALRLWPVPSRDVTLHMIYVRQNASMTSTASVLDVPARWQSTVIACLGARLCGPFQVQAQNQDLLERAPILYQRMRADDRPSSVFINPRGAMW